MCLVKKGSEIPHRLHPFYRSTVKLRAWHSRSLRLICKKGKKNYKSERITSDETSFIWQLDIKQRKQPSAVVILQRILLFTTFSSNIDNSRIA